MRVYLDHNATTPLRPEARAAWEAALDAGLGNPSSLHAPGRRARHLVDDARERIAAALGVHEEEIVFTSGGTEAINLALRGRLAAKGRGAALATAPTEHSAVRETAADLARNGHPRIALDVDGEGELVEASFARATEDERLVLVALSAGNHEIGTVHDLAAVRGRLPRRVTLFADAVQALGRVPLDLGHVDLAALSAHKVGGPTGIGVLVARRGIDLAAVWTGGGQERGLRPGTESAPAIAAAAVAIELAVRERADYAARTRALAQAFATDLARRAPQLRLIGPPLERERRLPNTLCYRLEARRGAPADGKVLVTRLDLEGVEVSAGSACASGSVEPSPVLLGLGIDPEHARSALRISLGRTTTAEECQRAADVLVSVLGSSHATRDATSPL